MKNFFRNLITFALLSAVAFLGWRTFELSRLTQTLRTEVAELETERRALREQVDSAATTPEQTAEQAAVRAKIEKQTSELRALPFKKPVNYKMMNRAALRDYLIKKVHEQFNEQELHDYARTLATIGLVPEGTDILKVLVSMYDEQVAAFYVPEERSLYTFTGSAWTSGLDQMLLSHELTHALQDQNYDLTTFPLKVKNNDDLTLATAALIEGDATVLMTKWYGENADQSKMLGDLGSMLGQNTALLRAAPAYLRDMLLFPYQQGQQFVDALLAHGGNAALDAAFRKPPASSQQILHPEMFLANRREPESITLPKISSTVWRLIGNNVLGEFGISSLLQESPDASAAAEIAAGWRGDRFQVYEHGPNGPTALLWVSSWTDEQAATRFADAYQRFAAARKANARVHRAGTRVTIHQSADDSFFPLADTLPAH